jgi:hypothetical protein
MLLGVDSEKMMPTDDKKGHRLIAHTLYRFGRYARWFETGEGAARPDGCNILLYLSPLGGFDGHIYLRFPDAPKPSLPSHDLHAGFPSEDKATHIAYTLYRYGGCTEWEVSGYGIEGAHGFDAYLKLSPFGGFNGQVLLRKKGTLKTALSAPHRPTADERRPPSDEDIIKSFISPESDDS